MFVASYLLHRCAVHFSLKRGKKLNRWMDLELIWSVKFWIVLHFICFLAILNLVFLTLHKGHFSMDVFRFFLVSYTQMNPFLLSKPKIAQKYAQNQRKSPLAPIFKSWNIFELHPCTLECSKSSSIRVQKEDVKLNHGLEFWTYTNC